MQLRSTVLLGVSALALAAIAVGLTRSNAGPTELDGLLSGPPKVDYAAQAAKFKKAAAESKAMETQPFKNYPQLSLQAASQNLDSARARVRGDAGSLKKLSKSLSSFAGALRSSAGVTSAQAAHRQHHLNTLRQAPPLHRHYEQRGWGQRGDRRVRLELPRQGWGAQRLSESKPGIFPAFVGRRVKKGPFNYLGNMEMAMQVV